MVDEERKTALLLPPPLEYLPQIFAPDPQRETALEYVRAEGGRFGFVDDGEPFSSAIETAQSVAQAGMEAALVLIPEHGRSAGEILMRELEGRGVRSQLRLHRKMGIGREESVVFLPAEVPDAEDRKHWLHRLDAGIERWGSERLRVVQAGRREPAKDFSQGAAWAYRFGLEDPEMREFLEVCVARGWPQHMAWWNTVLRFWHDGASPLEEMYAGKGSAKRMEDIVP